MVNTKRAEHLENLLDEFEKEHKPSKPSKPSKPPKQRVPRIRTYPRWIEPAPGRRRGLDAYFQFSWADYAVVNALCFEDAAHSIAHMLAMRVFGHASYVRNVRRAKPRLLSSEACGSSADTLRFSFIMGSRRGKPGEFTRSLHTRPNDLGLQEHLGEVPVRITVRAEPDASTHPQFALKHRFMVGAIKAEVKY